jgi:hypothetical protein
VWDGDDEDKVKVAIYCDDFQRLVPKEQKHSDGSAEKFWVDPFIGATWKDSDKPKYKPSGTGMVSPSSLFLTACILCRPILVIHIFKKAT